MYQLNEYGKKCLIKIFEDKINNHHGLTREVTIEYHNNWFDEVVNFSIVEWNYLNKVSIPQKYWHVNMFCQLEDKQYIAQYNGYDWIDCFDKVVSTPEKVKLVNNFETNNKEYNNQYKSYGYNYRGSTSDFVGYSGSGIC